MMSASGLDRVVKEAAFPVGVALGVRVALSDWEVRVGEDMVVLRSLVVVAVPMLGVGELGLLVMVVMVVMVVWLAELVMDMLA